MNPLPAIGRLGLEVPAIGVALGLAVAPAAALAHGVLAPAVMVMLGAGVCLAEGQEWRLRELWPSLLLALSNLLLLPTLIQGLTWLLGIDSVGGWLVLAAACPTAGSAVLSARLLGLPLRPLLLGQMLGFLMLPLTCPLIASLLVHSAAIDPLALARRVATIVGPPAAVGLLARLLLGEARLHAAAASLQGVGTLALACVGMAIGHELLHHFASPALVLRGLAEMALISSVGASLAAALGWVISRSSRTPLAGAFALGGVVRNVSLMLSATTGIAALEGQMLMQLATLWAIAVPAMLGLLLRLRDAARLLRRPRALAR